MFQYRFSMSGKISLKQLASEASFGTILQLSCSKFSLKLWEKPDIYQNCQKVKFEGALSEFEANILRQTLVLMWNSAYGTARFLFFEKCFAGIEKKLILVGRLGHWFIILESFDIFLIFPGILRFYVLSRSATR